MMRLLPEVLTTSQNLKDKEFIHIQVKPMQEFSLEPLQHMFILPDDPPMTTLNLMSPPVALPCTFWSQILSPPDSTLPLDSRATWNTFVPRSTWKVFG